MNDIEINLHLQDVKVDCIESVDTLDVTGNNNEFLHVDKVSQVKSHISSLKWAWALPGTIMWFANGLQQECFADDVEENWLTGEDRAQEKELMNKERKEAEKVKNDIESVQEQLEQHAEDIQIVDEAIKEQKVQIQNKLSVVKEKMKKLENLRDRKELLESQKRERAMVRTKDSDSSALSSLEDERALESVLRHDACGTVNYSKQHLTEKLEQTTGALEQCLAAVDSLTEHASMLQSERDADQKTLMKLLDQVSTLKMKEEKSLNFSEKKRLDFVYNFVTFCGLRVINVGENWMEVDISDIFGDSEDTSILLLTVHFAVSDGAVLIEDVTANCPTTFIKGLIDHIKSTHELKVFNFEIQKRFQNHVKLLKEMKVLQKRFAIDWNEEEQIVRLMLGKAGQIVCTLKIQNGYPSNGDVSVVEIHGADPAIIFQDSLMTKELKTLTSWIEYLDIKYS